MDEGGRDGGWIYSERDKVEGERGDSKSATELKRGF